MLSGKPYFLEIGTDNQKLLPLKCMMLQPWIQIKGGGRLDLCDMPLLTICKLHKHVICEINNECIIDE